MSGKRYTVESKLELIKLVEETGNVAEACKQLGYSRDSYYRIFNKYQSGGVAALAPQTTRGPLYKNRVDSTIETAILDLARCHPTWGQARVAHELEQSGLVVSPGGVRCVWQRNNLETVEKRLQSLVDSGASQQASQMISHMWPSQPTWLANQSIDTPGKLGIQDTLLVCTLDYGVKVYQQTFVDAFSRYVFARLYLSNRSDGALDLLNNYVLPSLSNQGMQIQRIATPRVAAYVGGPEGHPYEAYLSLQNIAHEVLTARGSQEISLLKSFYRYLHEQCFLSNRSNKGNVKLGALQAELEQLIHKYNCQHAVTRYGRYSLSPANVLQAALRAAQLPEESGEAGPVSAGGMADSIDDPASMMADSIDAYDVIDADMADLAATSSQTLSQAVAIALRAA